MSGTRAQSRVPQQPSNGMMADAILQGQGRRVGAQDRLGNAEMVDRMGGGEMMLAQAQTRRPQARQPQETPEQRQRRQFDTSYAAQLAQPVDANQSFWTKMNDEERNAYLRSVREEGAQNPAAGQNGHIANIGTDYYKFDRPDPTKLPNRSELVGNADKFYAHAFPGSVAETVTSRDRRGRVTETERQRPTMTTLGSDGHARTVKANDAGMVELPESGFGFRTHNRNDVRLGGQQIGDQWGKPDGVARTINTLADYGTMFPGSSVSVGDLSETDGSSPRLNSGDPYTRHGTHYGGSQVDMQYPSGTGSTNRAPTGGNDLFRANALLRLGERRGMNNFYLGTGLDGDMVLDPNSSVGYNRGHNDHIHMGRGNGRNG